MGNIFGQKKEATRRGMKELVLNMVCRLYSSDSGKALVRVNSCGLWDISPIPLFLRDVGKYYWNAINVSLEYGDPDIPLIRRVMICIVWATENKYRMVLKYFPGRWVLDDKLRTIDGYPWIRVQYYKDNFHFVFNVVKRCGKYYG